MDVATAMKTLESKGKPATAKTYARHGVREPCFGVSYADFGVLVKKIGVDHELALGLWKSGNHDARVVATMIADPARMTRREIETWIGDSTNYVIAEAVARVAARMDGAPELARAWMDSKTDGVSAAGWVLLGMIAGKGGSTGMDARVLLKRIRDTIKQSPNRTRHSMNNALIAIGGYRAELRDEALAVAKAIGKVEVDHGDTDCKTPDATAYIQKMVAYAKAKTAKAKTARSAR